VAVAVEHALFAAAPKRRYLVVPSQREAEVTIHRPGPMSHAGLTSADSRKPPLLSQRGLPSIGPWQ